MIQAFNAVVILAGLYAVAMMAYFYVCAFVCGPAVKYLGKKWEEGRQDAIDRRAWREGQIRLADYDRTKPPGETLTAPQVQAVKQGATVVREIPPKYTITGKLIP